MELNIILHGILREKLPAEAHGRTALIMPDECTIEDVVCRLDLPRPVFVSVNDVLNRDIAYLVKDGDQLRFFRPGAGG